MNCATLSLGSTLKVLTIEGGRTQYWSMLEMTRAVQTVRNHMLHKIRTARDRMETFHNSLWLRFVGNVPAERSDTSSSMRPFIIFYFFNKFLYSFSML